MDETKVGEKFLPNPLDTPEILDAPPLRPLLSTEEFLKTTPHHELKNMFGAIPDKAPEPKIVPPQPQSLTPAVPTIKVTPIAEPPKTFKPPIKPAAQKEVSVPSPTVENPAKIKPKFSLGKVFLGLFLLLLVLLIGLYVWGGILKERGIPPTTRTL